MDWIKTHYDRVVLLVAAVALVACSALLISKVNGFPASFSAVEQKIKAGDKVEPADVSALKRAMDRVDNAATWQASHPGSLFVSRRYLVVDGKLKDPTEDGEMLHPPVPNKWLQGYDLDILNANILNEDPDKDGFTVLDEFEAGSNPIDKASRPAFSTKLRLKRYIRRPFRLLFAAYDEDSYQINTLDLRQPSQFLKLGEPILGTKFKVLKFEKKTEYNPATEMEKDVSELTIQHVETQENVVLVLRKEVDSPDSFALFHFLIDGSEFSVKKGQKFALKVEPKVEYKLIDISEAEAVITNIGTDERIKVPRFNPQGR